MSAGHLCMEYQLIRLSAQRNGRRKGTICRCGPPKRHDSGAVAARYRHAFGGLSGALFGRPKRENPAVSAEFSAHGRPALAQVPCQA